MDHVCKLRNLLPQVVDDIVESYSAVRKIDLIDSVAMPEKNVVISIVDDLFQVIYPGYFGKQGLCVSNLEYYVGDMIDSIFQRLSMEMSKSIKHECKQTGHVCTLCRDRAEEQTIAFLKKIPMLREFMLDDVKAAFDGDPAAKSLDEIVYSYPAIQAITTYRAAHELYVQEIPLIPRIMTEYAHSKTGIDIHPGATIGRRFFIDHGTGVVIGETTIIGNNVRMYQGVTLGLLSLPKDADGNLLRNVKRHPTIEDDVTIYAGATILGGETVIGRGSTVSGNVWLTESVPSETLVVTKTPRLLYRVRGNKKIKIESKRAASK